MRAEVVKDLATTLKIKDSSRAEAAVQRSPEGRYRLGQERAHSNDCEGDHGSDPRRDAESELDADPVGCEVSSRYEMNDRQENYDREELCEREPDGDAHHGEEREDRSIEGDAGSCCNDSRRKQG